MVSRVAWLCLALVGCASCRLLVVFPVPAASNGVLGEALVDALLEDHHEVTYISVFPSKITSINLTNIDISCIAVDHHDRFPQSTRAVLEAGARVSRDALQHQAVMELLHDPSATFDAVIVDWHYSGLLAPLAELFKCPLIWYSSGDVSWLTLALVHEEPSAAYSGDPLVGSLPATPFPVKDRLYQLAMQLYINFWTYYTTHFTEIPAYDLIYRTPFQLRTRLLPVFQDLVSNGSLLLVNSHPVVGQALPMPLNAKHVGGHHIGLPMEPFSAALQTFLDNAKHGVILINLDPKLQKRIKTKGKVQLLDVLAQLEQRVVWQTGDAFEYIPKNVRVLEGAPQLSILCHPKTKLLIADGNLSSLMEAIHCGVPVVVLPSDLNQFLTADLVVARGLGIRVDFTQYFPWHLSGAIKRILENYSYKMNAEQASAIFRHRQMPAKAELLHWINLVISTRGAPHLRSPAVQVTALERYHVDLWILLVLTLWFMSKVLKVIEVHLKENSVKKNQ